MLLQTADSGYNRNYRVPGTVHNYKCRLGPINMGVWQNNIQSNSSGYFI